jgi:hypothetical protein
MNAGSEPIMPRPTAPPSNPWRYNLVRKPAGKDSFPLRRKVAGWDNELLASVVTA